MAYSSILGGERAPLHERGRTAEALGPSDTSDSGSDMMGSRPLATGTEDDAFGSVVQPPIGSDSDSEGTGERSSAAGDPLRDAADIAPDRVELLAPDADGVPDEVPDPVGELAADADEASLAEDGDDPLP